MVGKWYGRNQLTCTGCGHVSRSVGEEARHRHNFPAYCRSKAVRCEGTLKRGHTRTRCNNMVRDGVLCRHHNKG